MIQATPTERRPPLPCPAPAAAGTELAGSGESIYSSWGYKYPLTATDNTVAPPLTARDVCR